MDTQYKLPLGLFKQGCMKLDSFISDLNEIKEDADLDPEDNETLSKMIEVAEAMEATLLNIVKKECGEEDFLNENVIMDEIDPFPDLIEEDILNTPI